MSPPHHQESANLMLASSTSSSKKNSAGSKVTLDQSTVLRTIQMDRGKRLCQVCGKIYGGKDRTDPLNLIFMKLLIDREITSIAAAINLSAP